LDLPELAGDPYKSPMKSVKIAETVFSADQMNGVKALKAEI